MRNDVYPIHYILCDCVYILTDPDLLFHSMMKNMEGEVDMHMREVVGTTLPVRLYSMLGSGLEINTTVDTVCVTGGNCEGGFNT